MIEQLLQLCRPRHRCRDALCRRTRIGALALFCVVFALGLPVHADADPPVPLLASGNPVNWWFAFKFNATAFPGCPRGLKPQCLFGGQPQQEKSSQQFVYSGKKNSGAANSLQEGNVCLGDTKTDPVGATFDQVDHGNYFYVIWNDQFYGDPDLPPCHQLGYCETPWAHAKGVLSWDQNGEGFVMQVSTPNWPGAGNQAPNRRNGNTLGCLTKDGSAPQDDILLSQHFFAARLNKQDVIAVAKALQNASIVTQPDPHASDRKQVVYNGGPNEISTIVDQLGKLSNGAGYTDDMLSSGVRMISKSANLNVPPWHMISALLGGVNLRVATFYGKEKIPDTQGGVPGCWSPALKGKRPGAVINVSNGQWNNTSFEMFGGANHAKVAVADSGNFAIFGDLNQEGSVSGQCTTGHNGRGGLFFVVQDQALAKSLRDTVLNNATGANPTGPGKGTPKKKSH